MELVESSKTVTVSDVDVGVKILEEVAVVVTSVFDASGALLGLIEEVLELEVEWDWEGVMVPDIDLGAKVLH